MPSGRRKPRRKPPARKKPRRSDQVLEFFSKQQGGGEFRVYLPATWAQRRPTN